MSASGAPALAGGQRHAWLQKHPSPLAARGEFHWFPDAGAPGDRELRASFVERVRGVEPPAVLWQVERGRVAWGQVFSATAPIDGRRYVGLVLSVVDGDAPIADLLSQLAPPPPAPWSTGVATDGGARGLAVQELASIRRTVRGDVAGVIRALLSEGSAGVADPTLVDLPVWIASIERTLPPSDEPRHGVWTALDPARPPSRDRVAELAATAWREPSSRAAQAWTLLCELAVARGESLDRIGAALESIDIGAALTAGERAAVFAGGERGAVFAGGVRGVAPTGTVLPAAKRTAVFAGGEHAAGARGAVPAAGERGAVHTAGERSGVPVVGERAAGHTAGERGGVPTADERAEVAGGDSVVGVLHAWGRGRLDDSPAAASLPARLADLVALRVLVRLAADRDAGEAIAEARWYALLSSARRRALLAAVAARTRSLRGIVEAHHA